MKVPYEKTEFGYLRRCYANMENRVSGKTKNKETYEGLPLLSRERFLFWAARDDDFYRVYWHWYGERFPRRLSPSVDRINPKRGYVLGNLRWTTQGENSTRKAGDWYQANKKVPHSTGTGSSTGGEGL